MKFIHFLDSLRRCALVLAVIAGAAHASPNPTWTVVALPTLADGGQARAVNNRGDVAGTSYIGTTAHPVAWNNGVLTDLLPATATFGVANAINDRGEIAGMLDSAITVWREGAATALGLTGEPGDNNKSGGVAGLYYPSGQIAFGPQRGFYWKDGVLFDIGSLGNNLTAANGVNDRGVVVGYSRLPFSSTDHAVVWENGALRDLGTLGGTNSYAGDVTNRGVILGSADTPDGINHMVTWDLRSGEVTDLGARLAGYAINDRGAIVGNQLDTGRPFLLEDGQYTWLLDLPEMRAQGWVSFAAFDINDHGWIVGVGWKPGISPNGAPLLLKPR